MPKFGGPSRRRLETCDVDLQHLFNEVIRHFDCKVIWGHRDKEAQNKAFDDGNSEKKWPNSNHNIKPSRAIDVAPYPVDWEDVKRFRYFAGFVKGMAAAMGVGLRWGGDWDGDTDLNDQHFNDLAHFELKEGT